MGLPTEGRSTDGLPGMQWRRHCRCPSEAQPAWGSALNPNGDIREGAEVRSVRSGCSYSENPR